MIKLDENYSINCDGTGTTLMFQEERTRKNKVSKKDEVYTFKDQWYLLSVPQAIIKYRDLVLTESKDLKDVIKKLEEIDLTIKSNFN